MINISYNNTTKQLDKKILKISTYLKFLNDEKSYAEEPLPLLSTTDEIFNEFVKWFDVVCKNYHSAKKSKIFFIEKFEDYNLNELFDMFNFAMANQIKLLSYTIAKLINPKIKIYEISEKWWYVIRDEKFKIIDDRLTKQIYSLPFMTKSIIDTVKDFEDGYCKENDFDYVCSKEHKIPEEDLLKLYKLWFDAENKLFTNQNFIMMLDDCHALIDLDYTNDDTNDNEEAFDISFENGYLSACFLGHENPRRAKFTFKLFIDIINDNNRTPIEYKWLFTNKIDIETAKQIYKETYVNSIILKNENLNENERSEQSEQSERSDDDSSDDELDFE